MTICLVCGVGVSACHKAGPVRPDQPYIAPGSVVKDVVFHSAALIAVPGLSARADRTRGEAAGGLPSSRRQWQLPRLVEPFHRFQLRDQELDPGDARRRVFLLHEFAEKPADRFEDYTFTDLISDVESRFPAARTRDKRAIIGISMGGCAAIKIAFTRPDLFTFVAAFSPSIEVAHRRFRIQRWGEWLRIRNIFGPWGSEARLSRDPLTLVQSADPAKTPYIYLTAGENEPLLTPDRSFAERLKSRHFAYEFHSRPGGHDWNEWNSQIPGCFESLAAHLNLHQQ